MNLTRHANTHARLFAKVDVRPGSVEERGVKRGHEKDASQAAAAAENRPRAGAADEMAPPVANAKAAAKKAAQKKEKIKGSQCSAAGARYLDGASQGGEMIGRRGNSWMPVSDRARRTQGFSGTPVADKGVRRAQVQNAFVGLLVCGAPGRRRAAHFWATTKCGRNQRAA